VYCSEHNSHRFLSDLAEKLLETGECILKGVSLGRHFRGFLILGAACRCAIPGRQKMLFLFLGSANSDLFHQNSLNVLLLGFGNPYVGFALSGLV